MNDYQAKLFNDLTTLVETTEAFYSNDWPVDNVIYRNFNYRLASYTDFCLPSALECRGIMFAIDTETGEISLASLPFEKFFNHMENPFTMELDLNDIKEIADKADGSLITTYTHNGKLRLKSKGSLASDQAIAAMELLEKDENKTFCEELSKGEQLDCTIIMEFCSVDNRIVLPYIEAELKVLGVRNRLTGGYINFEDIDAKHFPEILNRWTQIIQTDDAKTYIESVDDMTKIEGVVFRMKDGLRVKKKCTWYLNLHKNKDNVNSPKKLFEAVVYETSDDLKSLFHDDPIVIEIITNMEKHVSKKYNHVVTTIEKFYMRNKHLSRKEYAILGQNDLTKPLFPLAMMQYLNKEVDYKKHMVKYFNIYKLEESEALHIED